MNKTAPFILIVSHREIYCHQFIHLLYLNFDAVDKTLYLYKQKNYIENKYAYHKKGSQAASLDFYIQHLRDGNKFCGLMLDRDSYVALSSDLQEQCIVYFIYDNTFAKEKKSFPVAKNIHAISYHDLLLQGDSLIRNSVNQSELKIILRNVITKDKLGHIVSAFFPKKHLLPQKSAIHTLNLIVSDSYPMNLAMIDIYFCFFCKYINQKTLIRFIGESKMMEPYIPLFRTYFNMEFASLSVLPIYDRNATNVATLSAFQGFDALISNSNQIFDLQVTNSWNTCFDKEVYIQILPENFIDAINQMSKKDEYQSMENNHQVNDEILKYKWLFEIKNNVTLAKQNHQLQIRLARYENTRMAKVKRKIKHYLNMLFRENADLFQSIRRFTDLFRFVFTKNGATLLRKMLANFIRKVFFSIEFRPFEFKYLTDLDKRFFSSYHEMRVYMNYQLKFMPRKYDINEDIKFSIVMPIYNPPIKLFKEALQSIEMQSYSNWELCMADDASKPDAKELIKRTIVPDSKHKICYRTENGHISLCTNDALALATGDYVVFMDQDDLITADCLLELYKAIRENPEVDILYSDEDKLREDGVFVDPHYKPDWAPDNLMSRNYFGHVVAMKRSLVDSIGGFRLGYEGSQDYDIILRATEQAKSIIHIPKVLYHWRIHSLSAANSEEAKPYAYLAAKKALKDALDRRQLQGRIDYLYGFRGYKISYYLPQEELVSIIIPTKNQIDFVKGAIRSIFEKTKYGNFEVLLIDNNSDDPAFFTYVKECEQKYGEQFRYIKAAIPFNFSKLMNIGNDASKGKYLCLLNNDTEIIHEDWLYNMVAYSQLHHIGAVGAKLLYPDNTIQHAGVIVGLGGVAGHAFMGQDKDDPGYFNYIQTVNNFSAVTAACLLCRKEVYEEVKGFDETFEVEFNDVDFCLKLVEKGYYNIYLPFVELYHYESVSRGHPHQNSISYKRHVKEMNQFKKKWEKYIKHDPYYNPNLNIGVNNFAINTFIKEEIAADNEINLEKRTDK